MHGTAVSPWAAICSAATGGTFAEALLLASSDTVRVGWLLAVLPEQSAGAVHLRWKWLRMDTHSRRGAAADV